MEPAVMDRTPVKIRCCECGVMIDPNTLNQCLDCMRTHFDITEGIPRSEYLQFCNKCERYYEPPSTWTKAVFESKEMMALCLNKVKRMSQVKLVDAKFLWTEPHSKRIKLSILVQKEVVMDLILEQDLVVEFTIQNLVCKDCHRTEAKDYWNAVVQIRQKTDHKRTFYYLEQLIRKNQVHKKAVGIKPAKDGMNFFYPSEQTAIHLVDFLRSVVPCKSTRTKKLKSHDIHSNTYNYKYTFSVEVVPICKGSIVCLPKKMSQQLGGINPLCVVERVATQITLIDPSSAQTAEISSDMFWRLPFNTIATSKKMKEFVVMDIEITRGKTFKGQGSISTKHQVGDVWVQRPNEIGTRDPIFCKSHLCRVLEIGDTVLGYDLSNSNINDVNLEKIKEEDLPSIILVRKVFGDKAYRNKRRAWKLRHIVDEPDINSENNDYMDFLEELEEDPFIRNNIDIFQKNENPDFVPNPEFEDENLPTVDVSEILNDMTLDDDASDPAVVDVAPDSDASPPIEGDQ